MQPGHDLGRSPPHDPADIHSEEQRKVHQKSPVKDKMRQRISLKDRH